MNNKTFIYTECYRDSFSSNIRCGWIYMIELNKKELARRIKAQRKYKGYTQEQVAELIGITYSSYVKIENAFQTPSLVTLATISKVLEISLDWLVFGKK